MIKPIRIPATIRYLMFINGLIIFILPLSASALSGTIVDEYGKPLSNALCYLRKADRSVKSAEDGSFVFSSAVSSFSQSQRTQPIRKIAEISGGHLRLAMPSSGSVITVALYTLTGRCITSKTRKFSGTTADISLKEICDTYRAKNTCAVRVSTGTTHTTLLWTGFGSANTPGSRSESSTTGANSTFYIEDSLIVRCLGYATTCLQVNGDHDAGTTVTLKRFTAPPGNPVLSWIYANSGDTLIYDMTGSEMRYCEYGVLMTTTLQGALYETPLIHDNFNLFSLSGDSLTITETIIYNNKSLITGLKLLGYILESDDGTIYAHTEIRFTRAGQGSGLKGYWAAESFITWKRVEGFLPADRNIIESNLGSDTVLNIIPWLTFLEFTDDSVRSYVETRPVDDFIDTWNGFYEVDSFFTNRPFYAISLQRIDNRTLRMNGNKTGESVTITFKDSVFSLEGTTHYESSVMDHAAWTRHDMPEDCTIIDNNWYSEFLWQNEISTLSKRRERKRQILPSAR